MLQYKGIEIQDKENSVKSIRLYGVRDLSLEEVT